MYPGWDQDNYYTVGMSPKVVLFKYFSLKGHIQ